MRENSGQYSGVDNLEVMKEAVNYNRFLRSCVEKHGRGLAKWLDFGAGIGTFADLLRAPGRTVECLEPDPELAKSLAGLGFTTFNDSADIPSDSYDYVYSLNVFEHIADDTAAAKEVLRVLRPGGKAFIYVPALPILFGSMDRKVGHFRRYTRKSLKDTVESAGLDVERVCYADSIGVFATLIYNLMPKSDGSINRGGVIAYDRIAFPVSRILDGAAASLVGKNAMIVARRR